MSSPGKRASEAATNFHEVLCHSGAGGAYEMSSACRLYFGSQQPLAVVKGHPETPVPGDAAEGQNGDAGGSGSGSVAAGPSVNDLGIGHCLTQVQLGQWQEAAGSLCELNRFLKEQYEQARRSCLAW